MPIGRAVFPPRRIEASRKQLERVLHVIRREYKAGDIYKSDAVQRGYRALERHYKRQLHMVARWAKRKGLESPNLEEEEELKQGLKEAKETWARLVADIR